ncbi:hypothetical protein HDF15_005120 [Granulicella mallensis]|uniref:Uncharacterized protein n=1 Tax=Granulicella mallensis TaxID=940614 RepID=A0A7W8ECI4_9BACT|nr:hypothetical protein [Granulicella mallensis]
MRGNKLSSESFCHGFSPFGIDDGATHSDSWSALFTAESEGTLSESLVENDEFKSKIQSAAMRDSSIESIVRERRDSDLAVSLAMKI